MLLFGFSGLLFWLFASLFVALCLCLGVVWYLVVSVLVLLFVCFGCWFVFCVFWVCCVLSCLLLMRYALLAIVVGYFDSLGLGIGYCASVCVVVLIFGVWGFLVFAGFDEFGFS